MIGRDPHEGFILRDHPFFDHVDGDPDCGLCGPLAVTGLEEPELPVLDRELHVLHVAVVVLELRRECVELRVRRWHVITELGDRVGSPDACDDVFALGVEQVVALELRFSGSGVAGHRHAGP